MKVLHVRKKTFKLTVIIVVTLPTVVEWPVFLVLVHLNLKTLKRENHHNTRCNMLDTVTLITEAVNGFISYICSSGSKTTHDMFPYK